MRADTLFPPDYKYWIMTEPYANVLEAMDTDGLEDASSSRSSRSSTTTLRDLTLGCEFILETSE